MKEEYYKTEESVKEYIELAKDVNSSQLIERLKNYLPENSTVLEIGSGPGTDWRLLNQHYNAIGSDFSVEFLNHLSNNNPNGRFLELDAITLKTEESFNSIYSNKVLQHLTDDELKGSIKRQSEVLKSGGIICHSFWKGEGSEIFKGMFVNYHNESSLKSFFENHYEILVLESYKEFEDDDSLLLIGRKL